MTSQPYTPESERPQDSSRALKVWAQLGELFGKAFYRENGVEPAGLWVQTIGRLADGQLATGLANLGNAGLSFPPNLSQFIEACKREAPVRQLGVKLLPLPDTEKKADADKAWGHMEKLAGRTLRPE